MYRKNVKIKNKTQVKQRMRVEELAGWMGRLEDAQRGDKVLHDWLSVVMPGPISIFARL